VVFAHFSGLVEQKLYDFFGGFPKDHWTSIKTGPYRWDLVLLAKKGMHVPYAPLVVVLAVPRSSDVVVMTMNFPSIQKETVHYDGRTVASATVKGPPTPSGASGP
jgi:hypothetical protein